MIFHVHDVVSFTDFLSMATDPVSDKHADANGKQSA